MTTVAILVLAAGASRRMRGADKLLQPVDGVPLLRRQAMAAQATGAPVFVALPDAAGPRRAALDGLDVSIVAVARAAEGMAHSLCAGVAAMPATVAAMMVVPADMPDLTANDFAHLISQFRDDPDVPLLRATSSGGVPGHPVLFPRRVFAALSRLTDDTGARSVLDAHRAALRLVPLPDRRAITDLDTPEDWAAWRTRTGVAG
ncbi:nucleotidyltransferase family protein [Actibacterium sp. D379-3]